MALRRARSLGVGVTTLSPRCLLKGHAELTVSSGPRLAGASDRADTGGVNSKRGPVPERKATVKQTPARAESGRKAQAAEEEHLELCGGDGDCFVSRADCKAADQPAL